MKRHAVTITLTKLQKL